MKPLKPVWLAGNGSHRRSVNLGREGNECLGNGGMGVLAPHALERGLQQVSIRQLLWQSL